MSVLARGITLALSSVLVATPAQAAADWGYARWSTRVCTPGALGVCGGVRVETVNYQRPDGSTGTRLALWLSNFAGTHSRAALGSILYELTISSPTLIGQTHWEGTPRFVGNAKGRQDSRVDENFWDVQEQWTCDPGVVVCQPGAPGFHPGPVPWDWWIGTHPNDGGALGLTFLEVAEADYSGRFQGCVTDEEWQTLVASDRNGIATCGGWAVLDFDLDYEWSANDITGLWYAGYVEEDTRCTVGGNAIGSTDPTCTIVPEPGTLVLFGIGLAALSGAAIVRRGRVPFRNATAPCGPP